MPSQPTKRRVVVAGATGRLGVLVDTLITRGHSVVALTRDPDSAAAARLRAAGAQIAFGDFDDARTLAAAAAGADALFATGTAHRAGPDGELRHGHNVAAAAVAAGVPHVVYSSGDGAAPDSPLPLFRVKHQVEEQIRSLPLAYTILAPVYFMENLFNPWNLPALHTGAFPSPIAVHVPLQQVAIADVAAVAALAVERPEEFAGQRVRLASDELTAVQAANIVSRLLGRPIDPEPIAAEELGPGLRTLFSWLERTGHNVDLAALRSRFPEVRWHSYEAWLRSQRARLRSLCPREHATV